MQLFKKTTNHKQEWLDEIHQRPEVRKVFRQCEFWETISWLANMAFFGLVMFCVWKGVVDENLSFAYILAIVTSIVGNDFILYPYLIITIVADRLRKKAQTTLQVFEDEGIEQIKQEIDNDTYEPGPKVPVIFKVFREIRKWTTILFVVAIVVVFLIKFLG